MAKLKEITITDNVLFFKLLEFYETKDYNKEATSLRNLTTEIEVRKRIPQSFKLELGMYSRAKKRIELEGSGLLIIIRKLNGEEQYRIAKGLPQVEESTVKSIDPETKYRRKAYEPPVQQQVTIRTDLNDDEIPF
jgi:hypothetical protein